MTFCPKGTSSIGGSSQSQAILLLKGKATLSLKKEENPITKPKTYMGMKGIYIDVDIKEEEKPKEEEDEAEEDEETEEEEESEEDEEGNEDEAEKKGKSDEAEEEGKEDEAEAQA